MKLLYLKKNSICCPLLSHFHPLHVNARLVMDEDDSIKFRLKKGQQQLVNLFI